MISEFNRWWIGLCLVTSLAGSISYGGSISFTNCTRITTAGAKCSNVDAGTSQITFADAGSSVTVTGFLNDGRREHLYVKISGEGEMGLGSMMDRKDHEITGDDFVNLDLSNLWSHGISSAQLILGSLQTGELYKVCRGDFVGSLGGKCVTGGSGTGTDKLDITWGAADHIFGIQATGDGGADLLIGGMMYQTPPPPTPEPTSLLLFGTGMAVLMAKKRYWNPKSADPA
jgi:PEP-CTERM motif